ncbi:MAG: DUF664 domain-containing protein [Anaerolineae bacterium]|nr:DUF664 domain-containing protein [Anaerolineae bacterium]
MHPFFADYLDRLSVVFAELEGAIGGLPQEGLDWIGGPEENSLNVLVTHASGATRYWIGDIAAQIPSERVRAHEFEAHGLNEQDLKARLNAVLDFAHQVLAGLTLDDLAQPRTRPAAPGISGPQTFTVGWALLHALEHAALHAGHAQIVRQYWEREVRKP